MPQGRKNKQKAGQILQISDRQAALEQLQQIPDNQLIAPLMGFFYSTDDLIRFRSIEAMGHLAVRMEQKKREKTRDLLRRLMWNLNDESGGIGWGSAEAMGEILCRCPVLAAEFGSILLAYLDPRGNYIDNESLQQGILWGIGTFMATAGKTAADSIDNIAAFLEYSDPVKRAYAVRALCRCQGYNREFPGHIYRDDHPVWIFKNWEMIRTTISGLAACLSEGMEKNQC